MNKKLLLILTLGILGLTQTADAFYRRGRVMARRHGYYGRRYVGGPFVHRGAVIRGY